MITLRRTARDRQPQEPAPPKPEYSRGVIVNYAVGNINLCTQSRPSVRNGIGTLGVGTLGRWKTGYDGGANVAADVFALPSVGDFTLIAVFDCSATSGVYSPVIGGDESGNRQFQFRLTNTNGIEFIRFNTAVSNFSTSIAAGVRKGVAIAVSNGNSFKIRFAGKWSSSGTITGTPKTVTRVSPNGTLGFDAQPVTGDVFYYGGIIPRALTDAEIIGLENNPGLLFEEDDDFAFFPDAVGGSQSLTPSLYTNGQSFYAPTVSLSGGTQTLTPALFTNSASFYAATLTASNILAPSLYSNAQSFYGPTLQASYVVTPSLYANASSFFAATLATSNALLPSLYVNGQSFYSPTVSIAGGPQQLTANRIDNTSVFYAPTLAPGAVSVAPSLYNNSQAFYALTVTTSKTLAPALFTNINTLYDPVVSLGSSPQVLSPLLFANTQNYFTQTVAPGSVSLFPVLLANSSTFYAPSVSNGSFSGSISDADINRIVAAVLAALNSTTIPVNAVMGWPSPSDIADAVWSKQLP